MVTPPPQLPVQHRYRTIPAARHTHPNWQACQEADLGTQAGGDMVESTLCILGLGSQGTIEQLQQHLDHNPNASMKKELAELETKS